MVVAAMAWAATWAVSEDPLAAVVMAVAVMAAAREAAAMDGGSSARNPHNRSLFRMRCSSSQRRHRHTGRPIGIGNCRCSAPRVVGEAMAAAVMWEAPAG